MFSETLIHIYAILTNNYLSHLCYDISIKSPTMDNTVFLRVSPNLVKKSVFCSDVDAILGFSDEES